MFLTVLFLLFAGVVMATSIVMTQQVTIYAFLGAILMIAMAGRTTFLYLQNAPLSRFFKRA